MSGQSSEDERQPGVNECVQVDKDAEDARGRRGLAVLGFAAAAIGGWLLARKRDEAKEQEAGTHGLEGREPGNEQTKRSRNQARTSQCDGLETDRRGVERPGSELQTGLRTEAAGEELMEIQQQSPGWRRGLSSLGNVLGSTLSTVQRGADMAVGSCYSSWCQRVFEGGGRQNLGGARRALLAQQGQFVLPHRGGLVREGGDTLDPDDLETDGMCSRVVQDVYRDNCAELLEELGFEIVELRDQDEERWHPKWTVVRHSAKKLVMVVYRGTWSVTDAVLDLAVAPVRSGSGVSVHGGMQMGMAHSEEEVHHAVQRALHQLEGARLIFTGHSYGGGCALLLRLHVLHAEHWLETLKSVQSVEAVTFGACHVFGNCTPEGAELLEEVHRTTRCYVHQGDVVPRLLGPKSGQLLTMMWPGQDRGKELGGAVAGVIGAYRAFGSFRFLYTVGNNHRVRLVEDPDELASLLEPPPLTFLKHATQDHATAPYFEKFQAIQTRQVQEHKSMGE